ncbi:hypothetical protein VVR64_08010 [Corynebacterium xerosis]|uniref:Uncharacterized protein n=1 Tax=Corynebacterium xerosis TaxID=1725 RepID=A0ABV3UUX2_9CORY
MPLSFQAFGDVSQGDADPVLVPFQRGEVDGVGEVGFEELVCFGFQPVLGGGEVVNGLGSFSHALIERRLNPLCELRVGGRGDGDLLVAVGDELFGDADGHGLPRARGAFGGSAGADVVSVADALFVAGVVELQPRHAGAAIEGALEVMVVFAAAFPSGCAGVQEGLDLLPGLGVDDGFVGAGMESTLVADLPDVVRVAQQLEERRAPHRPRRSLRCRDRGEAPRGGFSQQVGDGVLAFGVGVEHPADEGCPVGVDLDGAVLPAVLVLASDVEVADRCTARCAACGDFLGHAFGDFGGEVAGVELRDRGHDAVQQHAGGGFVDVLGGGDQLDAGVDEVAVDVDVIEPVAGQPVDLVHDAIRDLMGSDVIQHPLQLGPLRRPG